MEPKTFSTKILNIGFVTALFLSGICLIIAAIYMLRFQSLTSNAVNEVVYSTMSGNKSYTDSNSFLIESELTNKYQLIRMALSTHMYVARILLLSCGIFVGLAFGFLGFSLFLVGVNGSIDTELSAENRYKVQIARLSPGLFVILCASILIGICATRSLPVSLNQKNVDGFGFKNQAPTVMDPDTDKLNSIDTTMPN